MGLLSQESEMAGTCGIHEREMKYVQNHGQKTRETYDFLEVGKKVICCEGYKMDLADSV
jgi:hypothetical protein